jgi:hypothetical protein
VAVKLGKKWVLSDETLPACRQAVASVKLKGKRVGGDGDDDPADSNRAFAEEGGGGRCGAGHRRESAEHNDHRVNSP